MNKLTRILERASDGKYGEDSDVIAKMAGILINVKFESGAGPFICGALGAKGPDGLHDMYVVCPMYGVDVQCSATYRRVWRAGK